MLDMGCFCLKMLLASPKYLGQGPHILVIFAKARWLVGMRKYERVSAGTVISSKRVTHLSSLDRFFQSCLLDL